MKTILLGVTGSISAYKAADIANQLTKDGYNVKVILTKGGAQFITALTLQTLTKNKVYTDMFALDEPESVAHIALAEEADLVLIAPASADILAKTANGIADDMLTSTLLACTGKPILLAPAMNTHMYENPATQRNLHTLQNDGCRIIEPRESRLACGTVGKGALATVDTIVSAVKEALD